MMLFRMVVSEEDMPRFNQKKMETYCQKLLDVLQDDTKCERIFKGIVELLLQRELKLIYLTENALKEKKQPHSLRLKKVN